MQFYKEYIAEKLVEETGGTPETMVKMFKIPDKPEHGDLALPCFAFAKAMKKAPNQIAEDWAKRLREDALFERVVAAGPFLNFTFDLPSLAAKTIPAVLDSGERFGEGEEGLGKTVVLDFSSPNIAKPIAFHHIRSTVIGNALANLHEARGWKVVRINYPGDWGTQFGKLIVAYKRWGNRETLEKKQIRHLLDIYVKFHEEVENEPELEAEARSWFRKMEENDEEAIRLWHLFYEISLKEFDRIYSRLNIRFDSIEGESRYRDVLEETIAEIDQSVGTKRSEGALIVDMDTGKLPPCLLKKADGATLYLTRDIAAAQDRYNRFQFDRMLYVVAHQQAVHFKQLFMTLEAMGKPWAKKMEHVGFGMLQLADKTMSTRKGQVIFLEDVLDKATKLSLEAIEEKNAGLADKEKIAEAVGIGAIVFGDLIHKRGNDVTFEWERILNFQGETGVYVQYTNARARSMIRKAEGFNQANLTPEKLTRPEEKEVIKLLSAFDETVRQAAKTLDPSLVARHIVELCKAFNKVYNIAGYRFLDEDEKTRDIRLALAASVGICLKKGLTLLGVSAPEEM